MIDNHFRKLMPKYTNGILHLLKKLRFTPNRITIFAFLISLIAALLIICDQLFLATVVWWMSRIFDGLDGIFARKYNLQSHFGAYLDIVLDMAAYSIMVIALFFRFPEFSFQFILILFLYVLCITSALALGALEGELQRSTQLQEKDNRGLRLGAGLAEAGETGIAYTIFLLFPQYLVYTVNIWIAVLFITVVARTIIASKAA